MTQRTYLIHSSTTCPACLFEGKWTTDSSKFEMTQTRTVLPLDCPRCGATFEWEMVTGRATSRAVLIPHPKAAAPDEPAAGGAKVDDFFDNSPGGNTGTLRPRPPGGIPDLPAAPPPAVRPRPPGGVAPPPAVRPQPPKIDPPPKPAVAPKPPVEQAAPPPAPNRPPLPKPVPLPESDPPMTTPTGGPKQGFWKKFDAMPLWKQWAFILAAVAVVGVVIWMLPFIPQGGAAAK